MAGHYTPDCSVHVFCVFFFFQAEDGIRDRLVTGVQTCALPILHPVQQAFVEYGGLQCGYCTPGLILAAVGFLESGEEPTEENIKFALGGNLCRCTGYSKVIEAVVAAVPRPDRGSGRGTE